jgi:hypothetical protein
MNARNMISSISPRDIGNMPVNVATPDVKNPDVPSRFRKKIKTKLSKRNEPKLTESDIIGDSTEPRNMMSAKDVAAIVMTKKVVKNTLIVLPLLAFDIIFSGFSLARDLNDGFEFNCDLNLASRMTVPARFHFFFKFIQTGPPSMYLPPQ